MAFDPRWLPIAEEWLDDFGLPADVVKRHAPTLAQQLQDVGEQFTEYDIPTAEAERDEAAHDAHWQRLIDEARGK